MYERHSIDEILGTYGKEMTWDIKAGCMGKRKFVIERSTKFDSIFLIKFTSGERFHGFSPLILSGYSNRQGYLSGAELPHAKSSLAHRYTIARRT